MAAFVNLIMASSTTKKCYIIVFKHNKRNVHVGKYCKQLQTIKDFNLKWKTTTIIQYWKNITIIWKK